MLKTNKQTFVLRKNKQIMEVAQHLGFVNIEDFTDYLLNLKMEQIFENNLKPDRKTYIETIKDLYFEHFKLEGWKVRYSNTTKCFSKINRSKKEIIVSKYILNSNEISDKEVENNFKQEIARAMIDTTDYLEFEKQFKKNCQLVGCKNNFKNF